MVDNNPSHTGSTDTGRSDRSGTTMSTSSSQGPDKTDEEKDTGSKIVGRVQDGRLRLQVGDDEYKLHFNGRPGGDLRLDRGADGTVCGKLRGHTGQFKGFTITTTQHPEYPRVLPEKVTCEGDGDTTTKVQTSLSRIYSFSIYDNDVRGADG